jgi:hypothetical protein
MPAVERGQSRAMRDCERTSPDPFHGIEQAPFKRLSDGICIDPRG